MPRTMKTRHVLNLILGILVPTTFSGCSNAPVAGFLDTVFPSKAQAGVSGVRPPAGGVWDAPLPPQNSEPFSNELVPPAAGIR